MRSIAPAALLLLATQVAAQTPVPLYDNLGSHTHPISSRVPRVQRYFDQGLRLTYGFNHGEAVRAFTEAARLDSTCAICWWGVAYAWGPNINLPMDSAAGAAAWVALQQALRLRRHADPAEQAYIDALARRYGPDPTEGRARLDSAWAEAMADVARRYPSDLDAAVMAAEAAMNLRPWNYWGEGGAAHPGVEAFVARLERVLRRNPNHPGACHYYIHAVEASNTPERALPCARRLGSLIPGAGHLVHMPAHVYIRLGMYDEALRANIHAAHADETYIADARPDGIYPLAYYPHNLHFLWAVAAFEGRAASADSAMARLRASTSYELVQRVPPLELYVLPRFYHLVWFGRWDEILREPRPPAALVAATGLWHYARGRALLARGSAAEARAALDSVRALRAEAPRRIPEGITIGFAPPAALLEIAEHMLAGEISAAERQWDAAVAHLEAAVRAADALPYNEPADWYHPPRLSLGAVLLAAGRAGEAEAVYREDLRRNRASGWALFGLEQSLRAQGKSAEAARARADFERAWRRADVVLTASRP